MPVELAGNHYGETDIRLVRITRQPDRHDLKEFIIGISMEGDFASAHLEGNNRNVLPAGVLRNTVYGLARSEEAEQVEEFAIRLAEYFLDNNPPVSALRVEIVERPWSRVVVGGKPHPSTFARGLPEQRTAIAEGTRDGMVVRAGLDGLAVMKTSPALFAGYRPDPFSDSDAACERIFSSSIRATWRYADRDVAWSPCWHGVRQLLLDSFAQHRGESVQHTLYAMGEAVLESFDEIEEISLALPNAHFMLVNLEPFGLDNPNEIFLPVDQPHGSIEATLRK